MQNLIELLHLLQLLHFYCNKNSIMQMLDYIVPVDFKGSVYNRPGLHLDKDHYITLMKLPHVIKNVK